MNLDSPLAKFIKYTLSGLYSVVVVVVLMFNWFRTSLQYWRIKPRRQPPKSLTNLNFDATHKYYKVNGLKIHCVTAGDERKPLMLFVHGFPEFWYSWRHQMKYFCDRYWVVAMDMRGYADSDKPEGVDNYDMKHLTADIEQLVPALGREKIDVLVGHDWGGAICWNLVAKRPNLVDKYISINIPHPKAFFKVLTQTKKQFFMSWYIFLFQVPYLPELFLSVNDLKALDSILRGNNKEWTDVSEDDVEAFKYTYSKPGAFTAPINYYRANFSKPSSELLKEDLMVKRPTLMIWGDADTALCVEGAHFTKDFVKDYTLKIVEGAPHFITNTHPQIVNKHMEQWLNEK